MARAIKRGGPHHFFFGTDSINQIFHSRHGHVFVPNHTQRLRLFLNFRKGVLPNSFCRTHATMGNFVDTHNRQRIAKCTVDWFYFSHTLLLPGCDTERWSQCPNHISVNLVINLIAQPTSSTIRHPTNPHFLLTVGMFAIRDMTEIERIAK